MHFFDTNDKHPLVTATSAVSLLILAGLTLAGITVALAVMVPVLLVVSMILVPVVITTSFLATGFLASGGFGASGIALLFWLYNLRKEKPWSYNMHVQEVRPEGTNKLTRGEKPLEEENPMEVEKRPDEEIDKPSEEDKPPEEDKLLEAVKLADEHKLPPKVIFLERDLLQGHAPILHTSKVPKRRGPCTCTKRSHHIGFPMNHTKVRSIFMKEYQKVPRVGASAYKYFTSRDKTYINHVHI